MAAPDLPIVIPDAAQLRVLAHPLRSRLLSALRYAGPATATTLAARLATNSGATSYHLRQLAEVGLVEDDPERSNGRDRWWRAAHGTTSWNAATYDGDPDAEAAAAWLLRHHGALAARWVNDWLDEHDAWSADWRGAAGLSDYRIKLAPAELTALLEELHDVVRKHEASADPAAPGVEDVLVLLQAFPVRELRL